MNDIDIIRRLGLEFQIRPGTEKCSQSLGTQFRESSPEWRWSKPDEDDSGLRWLLVNCRENRAYAKVVYCEKSEGDDLAGHWKTFAIGENGEEVESDTYGGVDHGKAFDAVAAYTLLAYYNIKRPNVKAWMPVVEI